MIWKVILCSILAYLLGSIPSGVWIGKYVYDIDIRSVGSKNTGTTNAFRAFGPVGGVLVFLADFLKGALAVWIPVWLGVDFIHPLFFGVIATLGHAYPVFSNFKGGKAVATAAGIAFAYSPPFLLLNLGIFFLVLFLSSTVSLSSILAIITAFFTSFYFQDSLLTVLIFIVMALVIYRHRENIKRIINNEESMVSFGLGNYLRNTNKKE